MHKYHKPQTENLDKRHRLHRQQVIIAFEKTLTEFPNIIKNPRTVCETSNQRCKPHKFQRGTDGLALPAGHYPTKAYYS